MLITMYSLENNPVLLVFRIMFTIQHFVYGNYTYMIQICTYHVAELCSLVRYLTLDLITFQYFTQGRYIELGICYNYNNIHIIHSEINISINI